MSQIKNKNTKPEEMVRKYLYSVGYRYRKNVKKLPGCPDIVLKKYSTAIFINGCFWHVHECSLFMWPKTNTEFWKNKLIQNKIRDEIIIQELQKLGWKVLIVWECELKKNVRDERLKRLCNEIENCDLTDK